MENYKVSLLAKAHLYAATHERAAAGLDDLDLISANVTNIYFSFLCHTFTSFSGIAQATATRFPFRSLLSALYINLSTMKEQANE